MREIPISASDAEHAPHRIRAKHGKMPNGELRFRLIKEAEGTAYIRTEAPSSGAWQNAHYHEAVLETYIVQCGWIVLCELIEGKRLYTKYDSGHSFTTKPRVVHNVYMSANSVIHTVKHGKTDPSMPEDRVANEQDPLDMTKENIGMSAEQVLDAAARDSILQRGSSPLIDEPS